MKTFFLALLGMVLSFASYAQSPESINYQAVLRGTDGSPSQNETVGVDFTIRSGSPSGPEVYSESHSVTTNEFGLVNLKIGNGSTTSGNFSNIDWSSGSHFLEVVIDGSDAGTQEMVSVPYSLYANRAGAADNDFDTDPANEIQSITLNGTQLTLSNGGGSVTLPTGGAGEWAANGNNIHNGNSGNVGIGTSSPNTGKLVISTSPGQTGIDLASSDSYAEMRVIRNSLNDGDNNLYIGYGAVDTAETNLYAGGTNVLMKLKAGKVGIRTSNPHANLDIKVDNNSDTDTILAFSESGPTFFLQAGYAGSGPNGNHLKLKSEWDFNPMTWRANGNVGIGTTSPLTALSISPSTGEPKITLWDGGDAANHYGFGISSSQLNYHVAATTNRHVFYAGGKNGDGTELMRIQGNGNVGIGSGDTDYRLAVHHGGYGLQLKSNSQSTDNWEFYAGDGGQTLNYLWLYNTNGNVGAFNYASGEYTATSDRKLKGDIQPIAAVLPSLMKLKASSYFYHSDELKKRHLGFVAQEVEPLFPELVTKPSTDENDRNSNYLMNYAGFGVIAVKAIQEQQIIIENQKEEIENLNAEIEAIKAALAKAGISIE